MLSHILAIMNATMKDLAFARLAGSRSIWVGIGVDIVK